jgi:hypothetical protein
MYNFANCHGYSDVTPYEVVRAVSAKTMDIRRMNSVRDETFKLEFHVGGFSANCSNQNDQRWFITPDTESSVIRIRYSKANDRWQDAGGSRYLLSEKPVKFYDYNY